MQQRLKDAFVLNNGVSVPCIGFGTYQIPDGQPVEDAVTNALRYGYRHIDTASGYENERGIGNALRRFLEQSGCRREDVFITSKLHAKNRSYGRVLENFSDSMDKLGLEYLDLYLIHWPYNALQRTDWEEGNCDTWRAFEHLYTTGRIRAIGVSNFRTKQMESLLPTCRIKPMVNQIEMHPGWENLNVAAYCCEKGILAEAWSPLGRGTALVQPDIQALALKYGKTPAQICVRWVLQHGVLPIPKSAHPERIMENAQVFDFHIMDEDMERIDGIPLCGGLCLDPDEKMFRKG